MTPRSSTLQSQSSHTKANFALREESLAQWYALEISLFEERCFNLNLVLHGYRYTAHTWKRRPTPVRSWHGPALARQPSCLVNIQE
jgi:hypothetical protein